VRSLSGNVDEATIEDAKIALRRKKSADDKNKRRRSASDRVAREKFHGARR
jgi:hypothetical protein